MKKVFLRAQYNYDVDEASNEGAIKCEDPSLTRQSEAEEADINTIVRRFGVTGVLPVVDRPPRYGDFLEAVTDFQTAQNLVVTAQRSFDKLPADIRSKFDNDPAQWLDWAEYASESDWESLGLKAPKETKAEGVSAESAAAPSSPTGGDVKASEKAGKA